MNSFLNSYCHQNGNQASAAEIGRKFYCGNFGSRRQLGRMCWQMSTRWQPNKANVKGKAQRGVPQARYPILCTETGSRAPHAQITWIAEEARRG
jgi:hypothetical protein